MKTKQKNTGREVAAGGIGIAIAAILGWALHQFAGIEMPPSITAAVGGVIMWVLQKVEEVSQ